MIPLVADEHALVVLVEHVVFPSDPVADEHVLAALVGHVVFPSAPVADVPVLAALVGHVVFPSDPVADVPVLAALVRAVVPLLVAGAFLAAPVVGAFCLADPVERVVSPFAPAA